MWDQIYGNKKRQFWKRNKFNWMYLSSRKTKRKVEGHLNLRSCQEDAVIIYDPRIRKYMNKLELNNHLPPKIVKDTKRTKIKIPHV